jgi:hypothetical protein
VNGWVAENVLGTLQTMFMNGLKLVVAPVVFLSIASSVTQFSDLRDVGRIGGKVIAMYFITSVIAVAVGIGYSLIFQPGDPALAAMVSGASAVDVSAPTSVSLIETLRGIVPDNFLKSFVENNMLQLDAEDYDFSKTATERMSCEYSGSPMSIGFKGSSFIEILSNFDSTEVIILLADPSRAGLVVPAEQPEGQDVLMLMMPMLIND